MCGRVRAEVLNDRQHCLAEVALAAPRVQLRGAHHALLVVQPRVRGDALDDGHDRRGVGKRIRQRAAQAANECRAKNAGEGLTVVGRRVDGSPKQTDPRPTAN
jgi:hypothetical protein